MVKTPYPFMFVHQKVLDKQTFALLFQPSLTLSTAITFALTMEKPGNDERRIGVPILTAPVLIQNTAYPPTTTTATEAE